VEDHQLAAELLARMERDQQVRTEPPDIPAWLAVDADNTAWLEAVVDRQGWPLRSKVGEQAPPRRGYWPSTLMPDPSSNAAAYNYSAMPSTTARPIPPIWPT
jgi:hypothetical protein